jgi:hypothetical protein
MNAKGDWNTNDKKKTVGDSMPHFNGIDLEYTFICGGQGRIRQFAAVDQ